MHQCRRHEAGGSVDLSVEGMVGVETGELTGDTGWGVEGDTAEASPVSSSPGLSIMMLVQCPNCTLCMSISLHRCTAKELKLVLRSSHRLFTGRHIDPFGAVKPLEKQRSSFGHGALGMVACDDEEDDPDSPVDGKVCARPAQLFLLILTLLQAAQCGLADSLLTAGGMPTKVLTIYINT